MARLITIIIILALLLGFIVLNMNHKADISFGFKKFEEVPVFVSVLFAFVLGMLFSLPFGIALSRKLRRSVKSELPAGISAPVLGKKKLWGKNKKKDADSTLPSGAPTGDETNKDSSPYGID